jgi:S-adenosyl methyltransferase
MTMRSHAAVAAFFEGFELVEPGVVHLPPWRPANAADVDEHPERVTGLAGVGRKP